MSTTTYRPFVLDSFKSLFKDEGAFREFATNLESALEGGATPFLSSGKIIGVSVSKEAGKKLLCDHIITQWIKDPTHLKRLAESLEEEPVPME